MKKRWISVLAAGVMCVSLAACGQTASKETPESTVSAITQEPFVNSMDLSVPEEVKELTEEKEASIVGELGNDAYTNEYFGVRYNRPEGWTLSNDSFIFDGDSVDPTSLEETIRKGYGGVFILSEKEGSADLVNMNITSCKEDEKGLDPKALAEKYIKDTADMIEKYEMEDEVPVLETVQFCGEEYPAAVTTYEGESSTRKVVVLYLEKEGFLMRIEIMGRFGGERESLAAFEKL